MYAAEGSVRLRCLLVRRTEVIRDGRTGRLEVLRGRSANRNCREPGTGMTICRKLIFIQTGAAQTLRFKKSSSRFSRIGEPWISCTFSRFCSEKPTRISWFASAR